MGRAGVRHTRIRGGRCHSNECVEDILEIVLEECNRPTFVGVLMPRFTATAFLLREFCNGSTTTADDQFETASSGAWCRDGALIRRCGDLARPESRTLRLSACEDALPFRRTRRCGPSSVALYIARLLASPLSTVVSHMRHSVARRI